MKPVFAVVIVALLLAFAPAAALAQRSDSMDSVIVRFRGPASVQQGETVSTIIVVRGDATVQGTVADAVVVVKGTANVSGRVDGSITVVNGTLNLLPGATVDDVNLVRSDLNRDPAAIVNGDINDRDSYDFSWGGAAIFSFLFWLGTTIVVLAAGLLFAAVAGRQLLATGNLLTEHVGQSILATVVTWIALPAIAVLAFATLIGIPLGLALLILLLPALWFLGYLVVGTKVGTAITRRVERAQPGAHPYLAALLGLLIFQLIGLIPFVGGLVIFVAGLFGAGALVYFAVRAFREREEPPPTEHAVAAP